jgi:hypothetical protein
MTAFARAADIAAALLAEPKSDGDAPTETREPAGVTLADALGEHVDCVEAGRPIVETLKTGLALLDETTGGLVRGEFLGIIAAPGLGKTLLADRLALGMLRNHAKATALVFNLETATPVRVARLVCGESVRFGKHNEITQCLPLGPVLHGSLEHDRRALVRETAERLGAQFGGRLRFVNDRFDAHAIAAEVRAMRPDAFIVDHFGLVTADWLQGTSAVDQLDAALHSIRDALVEINAAGVFVAELTKSAVVSGAADIGAVRGSARFASLAGTLLTMLRDENAVGDDPTLFLELHKNRHGRTLMRERATLFGPLGLIAPSGRIERLEPLKRPAKVKRKHA